MIQQRYPNGSYTIAPIESWHPYPTAAEREPWRTTPASLRRAFARRAAEQRGQAWPELTARRYLECSRSGNRTDYEEPYFARRTMLAELAIAESLEYRGEYVDAITDGIWLICEESTWCTPSHIKQLSGQSGLPDHDRPQVDLFTAQTAEVLAVIGYLLGRELDAVSGMVRRRIATEIRRRVITPFLEREDFWWMGFMPRFVNNWNPWINSNVLSSLLLTEPDPSQRVAVVEKSVRSLDRFIDTYPADGGCDEGPDYWGHAAGSLFDCLEILERATGGTINVWNEPLIREMGRYICRMQIHGTWFANFADAPARLCPPAAVAYGLGKRVGDEELMRLGRWAARVKDAAAEKGELQHPEGALSMGRTLRTLFCIDQLLTGNSTSPLPRDAWMPNIQVMVARDREASEVGFFVAAKGGHNNESHNHNDIGSFIVYLDGCPLIVDAGVGTYTNATFTELRYTIWTMQSSFHGLVPSFGDEQQRHGQEFAATQVDYDVCDEYAQLQLDLSRAYAPEIGVEKYNRSIRLDRGRQVTVRDSYRLSKPVASISLAFLTPSRVEQRSAGRQTSPDMGLIMLHAKSLPDSLHSAHGCVHYDRSMFGVRVEPVPLVDPKLSDVWGESLTRVVFTTTDAPAEGSRQFTVTTMDNAR